MQVTRKNTKNLLEIQSAHQYNNQIRLNYAGDDVMMSQHLQTIPAPIYETVDWNFKLVNLNDFYKEDWEPNDMIANVAGAGLIRLAYDPLVESQFIMYLSLFV